MANHKSTLRRIRSDKSKALNNKYYHKTMRNSLRDLRLEEDKAKAEAQLPKLVAQIDKLAKRGTIHKNKAANLKSNLSKSSNNFFLSFSDNKLSVGITFSYILSF